MKNCKPIEKMSLNEKQNKLMLLSAISYEQNYQKNMSDSKIACKRRGKD